MAQWLRELAVLLGDTGLIPSTHMAAHDQCNSSYLMPLLTSEGTMCGTQINMQGKHPYILDKNEKLQ